MKKKIIFGFLVLVVLLCFLAQSWALDWKRTRQQYYERPEQGVQSVLVPTQTPTPNPSMIKFIFVPTGQNLPTLIDISRPLVQTQAKLEKSSARPMTSIKKTR
jgi:hypothetical protein